MMDGTTLILGGLAILSPSLIATAKGPGKALSAAMDKLKTAQPIAGVTFDVSSSAAATFASMRDALPDDLDEGQLDALLAAWLDAWSTGCASSQVSYGMFDAGDNAQEELMGNGATCDVSNCSDATTPIGKAACLVKVQRDSLGGAPSGDGSLWGVTRTGAGDGAMPASNDQKIAALQAVSDLANAMDARNLTACPSCSQLGDISLSTYVYDAATWLPKKIGSALGDVFGPYLWVALIVGGLVVYKLVTR